MNKKGSHVGIIASFGLFVLFLIVLAFIFEPVFKSQKDKNLLLESLESKLKEEFSSNLTTAIVSPTGVSCLIIANLDIDVEDGLDAIVKDSDNTVINSQYSGNDLIIESTISTPLWVYYSESNFTDTSTTGSGCETPEVKSVRMEKKVFEEKITNGINNYEALKTNVSYNFGFSFEFANGISINTPERDIATEVYSKEIPIQYINKDADTLSGKLTIRVW